jgi:hypothetical protein
MTYTKNKAGIEFLGFNTGKRPFYQQIFKATIEIGAKKALFLHPFSDRSNSMLLCTRLWRKSC